MADYDLVVRGGQIFDGSGAPPIVGDVAIRAGRVAVVGEVSGSAKQEIDARGLLVTPGFVDIHTHYDGQAMWESRMSPSSSHGVTTVVMGNCGVGFAPCRPHQHHMLVELMEGVEDIPEVVMTEGLPWNWETFPEYLEALEERHFDVDIATQIPHSALRVYVMGERGARKEVATPDDLAQMRAIIAEAVRSGALGVTTSRHLLHRSKAGELAPSLHSDETELLTLAGGLRDAGSGVFQLIPDVLGDARVEFAIMRRLAAEAQRPLSFTLLQAPTRDPEAWRESLRQLETANAEGLVMRGQVFPRPVGFLYGLDLSFHPFCLHPSFQAIADLPLTEKIQAMRDPGLRRRLLSERPYHTNPLYLGIVENFRFSYLMGDPPNYEPDPETQIVRQAERRGLRVEEYAYDLLLEDDGGAIFFMPGANYQDGDLAAAREMATHPHTVLGLGDGGAHYGMICDASFPTYYLEKEVRDAPSSRRVPTSAAVRALSLDPAQTVGLGDRGLLAPGFKADLNVIDFDRLHLHRPYVVRDLPAGGRRLQQAADGFVATVVSGEVTYRHGQPTGALPGRLVRGAKEAPIR